MDSFKSGFAAIIGRPNVGKSTLMNHLIGQKVAITSNRPQTTRSRIRTVLTEERGQIIFIDTPGMNVDDSAEARAEAKAVIKHSAEIGSTFCLIHHTSVEQLVNKNKRQITRLPDYLAMIRDEGMLPGLSAHMPEVVQFTDENGYDVETYIQIFNCMGFLMQIEIEGVARIIQNAKKPVMTIKPFAAGRTTPFVGLNFNWTVIRDCDMITVGVSSAAEAKEDIEISYAALEHRFPDLAARSSPVKQTVLGHK